ncbi:MAG: PAS domain S-box protein [Smithella sp.]|nr:PAS domain S-box protein [Smithella sp.]MDM7986343.1 PAS domain S-box protein [Smithella sp.]HOU51277.1 PAS domain S-box protein [Smithella sp.]HQG64898.1 PAS domain S-box protein [Smithella sp.]HQH16021.1 PAS domain S-box protein [Smithella sp.]
MEDKQLRLLMIEDSADDAFLIIRALKKGGYHPVYERVETASDIEKALREKQWDIILCDYNLPELNAPTAIALFKQANIDIPLLVVTGAVGEETATECMRLGAKDYIMKTNLSRLCPAIARELEDAENREKQRKVEEQLQTREAQFESIVTTSQEWIWAIDIHGVHTFSNAAIEKILGYTAEEIVKLGAARDMVFEEDIPLLTGTLVQAIEQKKGWSNLVLRWKHRDGTLRYLESNAMPIFDHTGNVQGFHGSDRDITERKKTEEMLRESEANYRQLFENSPAGIYQINFKSGKFIKANDVFCEYAGCTQEEITSLSPFDILTEESQKLFLARLEKISQGLKVPEIVEFEILSKKGKRSIVQLNIKNIYDEAGRIVAADVVAHDITDRKKAEERVHQSEEKYRNILEHMQEAYYEVDLAGNLIFCNDPLCRITGCSKDELLGVNYRVFTETENSKKVFKLFNKVYRTGEPEDSFDWQVIRKDNTMKYVEASVSLMTDATGEKTGFRGLLRDITDRKLAEEKLQHTLDSLKKAVGTTIQVLVSVLETRDPYTAGHQTQVANLACLIATEMGLDQERIEGMRMAGVIHDIGKLGIPTEILAKPSKLTDIEFSLIKQHPQSGYEMLKYVESPWPLAQIVYQHHERMNGTGYPRNLKGDEILLEARIMAVADVVDAMASHRPYRASLGIEEALQEIEKNKGILYDETVVNACLKLFREKDYKLA